MQAKYVLTCVLFSYSEQLTSTASCFREEEMKQLIQLLEATQVSLHVVFL